MQRFRESAHGAGGGDPATFEADDGDALKPGERGEFGLRQGCKVAGAQQAGERDALD
jgi:hypothetical protein